MMRISVQRRRRARTWLGVPRWFGNRRAITRDGRSVGKWWMRDSGRTLVRVLSSTCTNRRRRSSINSSVGSTRNEPGSWDGWFQGDGIDIFIRFMKIVLHAIVVPFRRHGQVCSILVAAVHHSYSFLLAVEEERDNKLILLLLLLLLFVRRRWAMLHAREVSSWWSRKQSKILSTWMLPRNHHLIRCNRLHTLCHRKTVRSLGGNQQPTHLNHTEFDFMIVSSGGVILFLIMMCMVRIASYSYFVSFCFTPIFHRLIVMWVSFYYSSNTIIFVWVFWSFSLFAEMLEGE